MKKTFKMSHPKIKRPRLVEAIKYEVRKYIRRERGKTLPNDADFWDFDCRYGADEASSEVIHLSTINKFISQADEDQLESFYLEILAKPGYRSKKPTGDPQIIAADPDLQDDEKNE
jgi:hypothetical protein